MNKGIDAGFFMAKQVEKQFKLTNEQILEFLEYINTKVGDVDSTFDIVNFAEYMMLNQTGFSITH